MKIMSFKPWGNKSEPAASNQQPTKQNLVQKKYSLILKTPFNKEAQTETLLGRIKITILTMSRGKHGRVFSQREKFILDLQIQGKERRMIKG